MFKNWADIVNQIEADVDKSGLAVPVGVEFDASVTGHHWVNWFRTPESQILGSVYLDLSGLKSQWIAETTGKDVLPAPLIVWCIGVGLNPTVYYNLAIAPGPFKGPPYRAYRAHNQTYLQKPDGRTSSGWVNHPIPNTQDKPQDWHIPSFGRLLWDDIEWPSEGIPQNG